ncbi:MAG TPA: NYN domain-containing protein, partial [Thermococcaceae archaeon]|nr:NYN domain-containing protein [Thermococcaceae archaeon]
MEDKYPQIGLVINGPNILLSKFDISLEDILYALNDIGRIVVGKVVINYEFSSNLLKSIIDSGLESVMVNGRVDVAVAVEGMKIIYNPRINVLALATRDAHFMPLVFEAKRMGKDVIVIAPEKKVSEAL